MGKFKKIGIAVAIFCISQINFLGFAASSSPVIVINNMGVNNAKILPMKGGCQKIINSCTYPIFIPLYPSGATKSFFLNKPSCVAVGACIKTLTCPGTLPANAVWNTSSDYIQTFDGTKWGPAKTAHYDATPSSDDCKYTCAANYTWNGSSCVADTQTYTCAAKPIGTLRNTVGSYSQTWNGTVRTPANSTTTYSTTASTTSCKYKCDTSLGYRWDTASSSCINTCTLPWGGGTKVHGETITAYYKTSGTCTTDNCSSMPRTCNGTLGTFDGSPAYQYASCTNNANTQSCTIANGIGTQSCTAGSTSRGTCNVVSCNAGYRASGNTCINTCTLPWGGTIIHNQTVTAYDKTSGTCTTNNCASETRTCNGTLGTLNGSYQYQSCTDNTNTQSCTIANGVGTQSCTAGSTSRGTCTLVSCNAGYRASLNTCINTCPLPWGGGTRVHGEQITAYDKTSGTCTTNNCASQTRTCNGTLGTFDGTYQYASCTPNANTQSCTIANGVGTQSCTAGSTSRGTCTLVSCNAGYRASGNTCINTCLLPWGGGTRVHGETITAYDKTSGICPTNNCGSMPRTCNGTLGTFDGGPTYQYASCTPNTNTQSCTVSNGGGNQTCAVGSTARGSCIVNRCTTDYYDDGGANDCVAVGIGYFSDSTSTSRTACTNYPDTASRNYTYTSDGNGTNSCTAIYTDLCGIDLYETSNGVCSVVGNGYFSPNLNNSRTACTNYPDTASRDYTYTSAGNGTNSCTASYSALCGLDLYETSNGVCSAVGNGYFSPNLNNTRTICTNKPSYSTYTSDGNGTNTCTWSCDTGYHTEDGVTCISNTKATSCAGKPLYSVYNTATSITQTWNGSVWLPSAVATYNATASTTECRYTCDVNYMWNGTSCVPSGCRTDSDCTAGKICQGYVAAVTSCAGEQQYNGNCLLTDPGLEESCASEDGACAFQDDYFKCEGTALCHLYHPISCERQGDSCAGILPRFCDRTEGCYSSITSPETFGTCIIQPAVCGNSIVESGEICDKNSKSCTLGGVAGSQTCNSTCDGWNTCSVVACVSTYDIDLCAGCYGSWTMSNCDNRECSTDGKDDAIWNCSYGGITKTCYSMLGDPCSTSTCFTSGTQVKISDGTDKNIENIQIGDKLLGQDNQINIVIGYDRPNLGERKLYSINNGPYFVTHEHPFMTIGGWKSISPEATWKEMPNFEILPLQVGDTLVRENGELEYIRTISSTTADPEIPLYNFKLDGNNTYYANGYLVHNKSYCGDGAPCGVGYYCDGTYCVPDGGGGGCFKEGTQIRLPDGTTTSIENIQTGNIVIGAENTQNTVLQLFKIWNDNWALYAINDSDYFVTDTHPFMTTEGWKSLNPSGSTKENPGMIFGQLEIGDILITEQGTLMINKLEKTSYAGYVYNFRLDGNKTYYADGYLVHNVETKAVE